MHSNTVWCISQSDETVFPPGLVAAGYAAGDVEPSVCYLVAQPDRRVVHTLPYRRRQYLVQVLAYIWLQYETWALAYIPSSQSSISSTSAPHQLNITSTSAPHQLHISSTSAPHQLFIRSSSAPHKLQINFKSAQHHLSRSLKNITFAHHFRL